MYNTERASCDVPLVPLLLLLDGTDNLVSPALALL